MPRYVKIVVFAALVLAGLVAVLLLSSGDKTLPFPASPLESASDLDDLIEAAGNANYVLLGESSHGTSDYYEWRSVITKRLVAEKDFSFIAVEGDWPYIYHANQYIKGYTSAPDNGESALLASNRWPEWMWANEEFLELVEWLRAYNEKLPMHDRVGLYGMDMQDLSGSIDAATVSLERLDTDLALLIRHEYACLENYSGDLTAYAQAYAYTGVKCENEVNAAMDKLLLEHTREDMLASAELFDIKQNMLAVLYWEYYARAIVAGGPHSWNTRVWYMKETVNRLSERYGENSKGIIWAHNTHVGDARATEMSPAGMVNIGQLLREKHGEDEVFIVGFGTYRGTVIASLSWGGETSVMAVPPAAPGSVEDMLSGLDMPAFIIFLDDENLPEYLTGELGHRAKGVVYNPDAEQFNYVQTILTQRYDVFIFIEETTALNPL